MTPEFVERYKFFRQHAGGADGHHAAYAYNLAKAESRAVGILHCYWEDEEEPWDGDCPAPRYLLCGLVYRVEDCTDHGQNLQAGVSGILRPMLNRWPLASLGMVGVDRIRDPYLRVVAAELYEEALDELDREYQQEANTLSERPTYAGVSP